jgi:hypothetical protein
MPADAETHHLGRHQVSANDVPGLAVEIGSIPRAAKQHVDQLTLTKREPILESAPPEGLSLPSKSKLHLESDGAA